MLNIESILRNGGITLEETRSIKDDHAVLQVQRGDTGSFVLRLYRRTLPAYQALARFGAEGFPVVYMTYEEDGFFIVEEELAEGISLQRYLEEHGPMKEMQAVEITLQICMALGQLHKRGFIHRDVKPEHVLLTDGGRICIIDLDASMEIHLQKTQDTQLIGTVVYAAPEQFGLTRSDQRSDVYAVGILLNEMLTGAHPTVKQYRTGRLGTVIEICTKISPEDRYQSMEQLMDALGDPTKYAPPAPSLRHRNRIVKMAAAGTAAAVVLFGLGWGLAGQQSENVPEEQIFRNTNELPYRAEYVVQPVRDEGAAPAMEGEWLQMYKYDQMEDYAQVHRDGAQGARYYTEDGTLIDDTFHVYCDPQVGVVNFWRSEHGGWDIVSQGCNAGDTGYIYAEKDGKKYALDVLVLGESMSAYTQPPNLIDFTEGYLQSRQQDGKLDTYIIDYTYQRDEPVTIYLAAAMGMNEMTVYCTNPLVTIEPCPPSGIWNGPVYSMTFENPAGGDVAFEVTSNMNPLTFHMKEVNRPGH